jgi:HK97 family phage portal protein
MAVLSPDDYRRASGFRRSESPRLMAERMGGKPSGPIVAYDGLSLHDPALVEMMRQGRTGVSGIAVNERKALQNSTFFRALWLQSASMGMLPLHLRRRKGKEVEKATGHAVFNILHRKPNDFQTPSRFKSYMQTCALLDGGAYALKIRSRGAIRQLIPLERGACRPELSDTWGLQFNYQPKKGSSRILHPDDVFHFGSPLTLDGLNGVALLDVAADTLGIAVRAQQAASRLLVNGTMARGALETDATLGDEAIDNLKQSLRDDYAGVGATNDWLILEEGLKAKLFAGSARESQLVEIMKREAEEISRFTGVPRPLLMFDETSWGSGIEQLGLFFVTYCLMPWFVIWEEAVWMWLLSAEEQQTYYAKYNEGALLRGSLKDQADFLKAALGPNVGYITQNEARETVDRNPIEGGDDLPRPGTTAHAIMQEEMSDAK